MKKIIIITILAIVTGINLIPAFGHGVGYELLPAKMLGDKEVAMEVSSSLKDNPNNPDRQITFSLFETSNKITLTEVTYQVQAMKGEEFLFDETFETDNGIFMMDFVQSDSEEIIIEKQNQLGFLGELIGIEQQTYVITGSAFNTGGLYTFVVDILTADSYSNKLAEPIQYDVGLSIPDRVSLVVEDPNFGPQEIDFITYYDRLENIQYDIDTKEIQFSMPFEWTIENINQTSVVHEEFTISKTFGDLLTHDYFVSVNGVELSNNVVTIDDFSFDTRIVHLIVNQDELTNLFENQKIDDGMNFLIKPRNSFMSTVTENGQFRIQLDWMPFEIKSGSPLTLLFNVTDVFLKDRPVAVSFDLALNQSGNNFFKTNGMTTDSRDKHNQIDLTIPEGISGLVYLYFENLNGNDIARVTFPLIVDRVSASSEEIVIPEWIKNNAGWWAENRISDKEFVNGIEFLINKNIIMFAMSEERSVTTGQEVPEWIKNNAGWWAEDRISDKEFVNGIEFLVTKGIILV